MTLCKPKSAACRSICYDGRQVLIYDMPMNEVVMDFFDKLKSTSSGYASRWITSSKNSSRFPGQTRHLVNGEKWMP